LGTTETQRTQREAVGDDEVSRRVIGAAIEVHRHLGPGLLESTYEECLCRELSLRSIAFHRQEALPVVYKGVRLDCGYRLDLVVEDALVVELKAVDEVTPLHLAQMLTYLRMTRITVGLIINFNVAVLKDGITRVVL
jgi:GxxExxY protein